MEPKVIQTETSIEAEGKPTAEPRAVELISDESVENAQGGHISTPVIINPPERFC